VRSTHRGTGNELLVASAVLDVEWAGQFSRGCRGQQLKAPGTSAEGASEHVHEAGQQVFPSNGFGFRMVEAEKRLGFGLPHLEVSLIQGEARDQLRLFAGRCKGTSQGQIERCAELSEDLADLGEGKIQAGQAAPLIFHLLQELVERTQAAGGGRRDAEERADLQGIVGTLAQDGAKLPVEAIGEGPDGAQQQA
jgi:hypothetical protein